MLLSGVRWAVGIAGAAAVGAVVAMRAPASAVGEVSQSPPLGVVVAELFTSEGCSSCPPADDLLADLVERQPVAGVEVVGLGEHVDYWNRLGWSDPFSSAGFSQRQSEYNARRPRAGGSYTPQVVIDGRLQAVGSDRRAVESAIALAARDVKATVAITAVVRTGAKLRLDVDVDAPRGRAIDNLADVVVAVTEDRLASSVRTGENQGRVLRHSSVVRRFASIAVMTPGMRHLSTTASVMLDPDWKAQNLKVTAFLQQRQSWRIVGAGSSVAVRSVVPP